MRTRSRSAAPGWQGATTEADWYSNLGIVFQSDGKVEAAIDAYRRAIAIDPSHANAHSNLGVLLRATGKPSEAEAAYRTAIQLNPDHIDAYTNLGVLLNGVRTRGARLHELRRRLVDVMNDGQVLEGRLASSRAAGGRNGTGVRDTP